MTIKELIEQLKKCPQNLTVFVPHNFTPRGMFRPLKWGRPDLKALYGMEPRCSVEIVEDMQYGGEVFYSEIGGRQEIQIRRNKMKGLIIR